MRIPTAWEQASLGERKPQADRLARELQLHPVIARILVQRGLGDPDAASRFLNPSIDQLHDPFLIQDLPKGVDRILAAIDSGERIAVHGDYDVDGITSTVMLHRMIELLGGNVVHFIPQRLADGYGLQADGIDRLKTEGVDVVVSVDCGIRSREAAERALAAGIDLVITDHHEPDADLPDALAVINPRRSDCSYPNKDLAGVGVAFKVVEALCLRSDRRDWLPAFLKLAALGTIADIVPLLGENRVIASLGLDEWNRGRHTAGLKALVGVCKLHGGPIGSREVAFRMAPRLNAAGRMSTPDLAAQLLLTKDPEQAARLAGLLDQENTRRRNEEESVTEAARRQVETDPDVGAHNVLVVWGDHWHRGVIGIVASRLVERYCKPAIVLSIDGDTAHGSGRSVAGFDLLAALEQCANLFDRFGGHRQAAGLAMPSDRLLDLRQRMADYGDTKLDPSDLVPRLAIDANLALTEIDETLFRQLAALEPHGSGHRQPVFVAAPVSVVDQPREIRGGGLRMTLEQRTKRVEAVAWGAAARKDAFENPQQNLRLAYTVNRTTYRGVTYQRLTVTDIK